MVRIIFLNGLLKFFKSSYNQRVSMEAGYLMNTEPRIDFPLSFEWLHLPTVTLNRHKNQYLQSLFYFVRSMFFRNTINMEAGPTVLIFFIYIVIRN